MIGKKVLIRSYAAGVFFGTLLSLEHTVAGTVIELEDSRRIHYWEGAASLSQVSQEGIAAGRVAMTEPFKMIVNAVEVTPLADKAVENLYGQPVWKA